MSQILELFAPIFYLFDCIIEVYFRPKWFEQSLYRIIGITFFKKFCIWLMWALRDAVFLVFLRKKLLIEKIIMYILFSILKFKIMTVIAFKFVRVMNEINNLNAKIRRKLKTKVVIKTPKIFITIFDLFPRDNYFFEGFGLSYVKSFERKATRFNEIIHLIGLLSCTISLLRESTIFVGILTVINFYCIALQRYNRSRMYKVLEKATSHPSKC